MHSVQVDLESRLEKLETLTGPAEIVATGEYLL
jgi:hypothetical protein